MSAHVTYQIRIKWGGDLTLIISMPVPWGRFTPFFFILKFGAVAL